MIVITMDGGLIQNVCSDDPNIKEAIIIDYDIEGCDEPTVNPFGSECRIMTREVDPMDKFDVGVVAEAAQKQADLDEAFVPGKEDEDNG